MPNRSREKGDRFERQCVHDLNDMGVPARRVPMSGSANTTHDTDDLIVEVNGYEQRLECKTRARAWGDLFGWLQAPKHSNPPFALLIKADRTETLVVMPLATFAQLSKGIL